MIARRRSIWSTAAFLLATGVATTGAAQTSAELEDGIRAYTEQGDAREAIRRIGSALDGGSIPATVRPRAHVYMAHAFLALNDSASALPHIQRALAAEPCLLPSSDLAPPSWIELYERNRPSGFVCSPQAVTATLKSMLVPGWGQRSLGREGMAGYLLGVTVTAAAGSAYFLYRGDQRYAAYESSTNFTELTNLYDQARGARRNGLVLGGVAATVYLWNLVDVISAGLAHDRAIARVRPLAALPFIYPTGTGAGFALHLQVR